MCQPEIPTSAHQAVEMNFRGPHLLALQTANYIFDRCVFTQIKQRDADSDRNATRPHASASAKSKRVVARFPRNIRRARTCARTPSTTHESASGSSHYKKITRSMASWNLLWTEFLTHARCQQHKYFIVRARSHDVGRRRIQFPLIKGAAIEWE